MLTFGIAFVVVVVTFSSHLDFESWTIFDPNSECRAANVFRGRGCWAPLIEDLILGGGVGVGAVFLFASPLMVELVSPEIQTKLVTFAIEILEDLTMLRQTLI